MLFAIIDYILYRKRIFKYSDKSLKQMHFFPAFKNDKSTMALICSMCEDFPLNMLYHRTNSFIAWVRTYYGGFTNHSAQVTRGGVIYEKSIHGEIKRYIPEYFNGKTYLAFTKIIVPPNTYNKIIEDFERRLGMPFKWQNIIKFWISTITGANLHWKNVHSFDIILLIFGLAYFSSLPRTICYILVGTYVLIVLLRRINLWKKHCKKYMDIGDKVILMSGGPEMKVTSIKMFRGKIECEWFEGNNHLRKYFPVRALQKAKPTTHSEGRELTSLELSFALKQGWILCPKCDKAIGKTEDFSLLPNAQEVTLICDYCGHKVKTTNWHEYVRENNAIL